MATKTIYQNMAQAHGAAKVIQSAWYDYIQEYYKDFYEPVYENRTILGYVDQEEKGRRDILNDRVGCERLWLKYLPTSRYYHPDNYSCSSASPSPTCKLCFRYFCPDCDNGVSGMFIKCRATKECREKG